MKKNQLLTVLLILIFPIMLLAQSTSVSTENWLSNPGIIGTIILIIIVLFIAVIIMFARLSSFTDALKKKQFKKQQLFFSEELISLDDNEIDEILTKRKEALRYKLSGTELGSDQKAEDQKGLINKVYNEPHNPIFDEKKKDTLKS